MMPDGQYHRVDHRKAEPFDSQIQLAEDAIQAARNLTPEPKSQDHFTPIEVNATAIYKGIQ
jgi:hypothetical protein